MRTLPWFPPAPASGPASILSLPPDDWVMEPKINGVRVIIYHGQPFTRWGEPLSDSKGAARLRTMFTDFDRTLDGEWVLKEQTYYAFDLPDEGGDYDHRSKALLNITVSQVPGLVVLKRYATNFARAYEALPRNMTEGVVFKRRSSLYVKQARPSSETRDWLKRRFAWDPSPQG